MGDQFIDELHQIVSQLAGGHIELFQQSLADRLQLAVLQDQRPHTGAHWVQSIVRAAAHVKDHCLSTYVTEEYLLRGADSGGSVTHD